MSRFAQAMAGLGLLIAALFSALAVSGYTASAQSTVTVEVGDIYFCDPSFKSGVCDTTITAGDTVTWDFGGADIPHTTTECGSSCDSPTASPLWDSGFISDGSSYSHTFTDPGTYLYFCQLHPNLQRGRIIVEPEAGPTAVETPDENGAPTPSDGVTPAPSDSVTGVPTTGAGPDGGSTASWWLVAALGATATAGLLGGFGLRARSLRS